MIARRVVWRMLAPAVAMFVACTSVGRGAVTPHIDSVQPDSVMLRPGTVVEVVVRGRGFAPGRPGRNTVTFGEVKIGDVPASEDGREIRLVVPDRVPSRGEAAPLPLDAGRYDITVQTTAGVSNAVSVKVDR